MDRKTFSHYKSANVWFSLCVFSRSVTPYVNCTSIIGTLKNCGCIPSLEKKATAVAKYFFSPYAIIYVAR